MKPAHPQTAAQFAAQLRAPVDPGWHREAVVYAERFSRQFLPQLSNEEHSRITGMHHRHDGGHCNDRRS
jgi:hypothetical protein